METTIRTLLGITEGELASGVAFSEAHHRSYLLYLCCLLILRLFAMATFEDLRLVADLFGRVRPAVSKVWAHLRAFRGQYAKDSQIPRWIISYDVVHTSEEEVRATLDLLAGHVMRLKTEAPAENEVNLVVVLSDLERDVRASESPLDAAPACAFRQTYD